MPDTMPDGAFEGAAPKGPQTDFAAVLAKLEKQIAATAASGDLTELFGATLAAARIPGPNRLAHIDDAVALAEQSRDPDQLFAAYHPGAEEQGPRQAEFAKKVLTLFRDPHQRFEAYLAAAKKAGLDGRAADEASFTREAVKLAEQSQDPHELFEGYLHAAKIDLDSRQVWFAGQAVRVAENSSDDDPEKPHRLFEGSLQAANTPGMPDRLGYALETRRAATDPHQRFYGSLLAATFEGPQQRRFMDEALTLAEHPETGHPWKICEANLQAAQMPHLYPAATRAGFAAKAFENACVPGQERGKRQALEIAASIPGPRQAEFQGVLQRQGNGLKP